METNKKPARVRFAPSPTGRTHLGSARTALYNYLIANQSGGEFILRIEDTDQKRYVPGAELELMDGLKWLGLLWDEGPGKGGPYSPYRQSERKDIYKEFAEELVDRGHAFYCFCKPERLQSVRKLQLEKKEHMRYDGTCRRLTPQQVSSRIDAGESHVIRYRMPMQGTITVLDRLRGEITFENRNLDDSVLVKSDGLALYHLAAMVDDHLMGVTHVIRSAEWLSTFGLHAHIIRAFGWEEPEWVHLSIFLKPSGKGKMSKRESSHLMKDGYSIFLEDLIELGYIPEAINNWTALMGWSFDDHTEFFTLEDLVSKFSLDRCNPAPAAINFSKLDHFNGLHIRSLDVDDLAMRLKPFFESAGYNMDNEILHRITPLIQERMVTLEDGPEKAGFFFLDQVTPNPKELVGKKMTPLESAYAARQAYILLAGLQEINHNTAEGPMRELADELGLKAGQLFGIIRVAVTGQKVSPPLFESMEIIGKECVLERIEFAVNLLESMDGQLSPDLN